MLRKRGGDDKHRMTAPGSDGDDTAGDGGAENHHRSGHVNGRIGCGDGVMSVCG